MEVDNSDDRHEVWISPSSGVQLSSVVLGRNGVVVRDGKQKDEVSSAAVATAARAELSTLLGDNDSKEHLEAPCIESDDVRTKLARLWRVEKARLLRELLEGKGADLTPPS